MRTLLARYGYYLFGGILLLAIILYFALRPGPNPEANPSVFYVDEETGEESVHPVTDIPPLPNKSGKPTLARATKISCDGGKTSRVAFLEKYTPQAQELLKSLPIDSTQRIDVMRRGALIRLPGKDSPWLLDASPDGQKIREAANCPDGQTPTLVLPS